MLLAAATLAQPPGQPRVRQLHAEDGLLVILLGTGMPVPNPDRACAATLVLAGDRAVLVDTGRGCLNRLAQAGFPDVSMILYTHFHSDHFGELGELMVNRTIGGAVAPMPVFGPPGAREVVSRLLSAYEKDSAYRKAHHGEKWHEAGMKADVHECEPGVIYDEGGLKITMFKVDHEPAIPAVGYRFDFRGHSIVVSGDTKPIPAMAEAARGCDILVHEALDAATVQGGVQMIKARDPRRAEMMDEMMRYHSPTLDVARIASQAGVKKLVLTHLVPSIAPSEAAEHNFIRGMAELFHGQIIVGRDLMEIAP